MVIVMDSRKKGGGLYSVFFPQFHEKKNKKKWKMGFYFKPNLWNSQSRNIWKKYTWKISDVENIYVESV